MALPCTGFLRALCSCYFIVGTATGHLLHQNQIAPANLNMNFCKIDTEPETIFYKDVRFWALLTSVITLVTSVVSNYPIVL
jgi:hypothetical protein